MTRRENPHRERLDAADHELSVLAAQAVAAEKRLQTARQDADEAAIAEAEKLAAELAGRYRQLTAEAAALAAALASGARTASTRERPRTTRRSSTALCRSRSCPSGSRRGS